MSYNSGTKLIEETGSSTTIPLLGKTTEILGKYKHHPHC